MNKRAQGQKQNIKTYLIPLVIITLTFILTVVFTLYSIRTYFQQQFYEDTLSDARSFNRSITESLEAQAVIDRLLKEKLLAAAHTAVHNPAELSNAFLKDVAAATAVDEIHVYNADRVMVYDSTEALIGWTPPEGHPLRTFMEGSKVSYVDTVRESAITKKRYHYAYLRADNGWVIQVAIRAEHVEDIKKELSIGMLLRQINNERIDMQVSFVDCENCVVATTEKREHGQVIDDEAMLVAIEENRVVRRNIRQDGRNYLQVYYPVYFEGGKEGTLILGQPTSATDAIINRLSLVGGIALIVLYMAILYSMQKSYFSNKKLTEYAYYDDLTGLANKKSLKLMLKRKLGRQRQDKTKRALMLVNIRDFKLFNLTLGFDHGDLILKDLAGRLLSLEDQSTRVYKFSVDRFVVYREGYKDEDDLWQTLDKIKNLQLTPVIIDNIFHYLDLEIGVVEGFAYPMTSDEIFKDMSIALTEMEASRYDGVSFYEHVMQNKLRREDTILRELRRALAHPEEGTLYMNYQPQLDLKTGRIEGFEVLARMKSKACGQVGPAEFIAVAEKKHLIVDIGRLVLAKSLAFLQKLNSLGHDQLTLAVNISVVQLLRDDFLDNLFSMIEAYQVDPCRLELEITETVLMHKFDRVNEKLRVIQEAGIRTALDDFGTGYSNLSRLRSLYINTLKIDKTFIDQIAVHEEDELLTSTIIIMGHRFKLSVVAEGVETQDQKDYLIRHGCDTLQGYLFSRPLGEKAALERLEEEEKEVEKEKKEE